MRGGDAEPIQTQLSADLVEKRYILQIKVEHIDYFFSLVLNQILVSAGSRISSATQRS